MTASKQNDDKTRSCADTDAQKPMDVATAREMALEALLIRADQWREWATIQHVDLEEMYESTAEESRAMAALYRKAYEVLSSAP